jgi:outer membrane receptor for ferrienterochelin and colicins
MAALHAATIAAVVALVCLFAAVPAAAQERAVVTIFVRGPEGPVPRATITAGETVIPADDRGIARFSLTVGTHSFQVGAAGFAPRTVTLHLPAPRDTALVVQLEEALVIGEPIIVLSTRGARRIEEEPLRVEVIVREEIEEKLMMRPGSIAMLLAEAPGVRVQEATPALGGASVRIQGLRGEYTRILVDGLPLHGAAGALGPLQIPPADLRQVEVIKGAVSALYGGSAMGGVVNLISRVPEEGREVITNRTSRGGTDVVLWSSDPLSEAWGYTLIGGLHAQDETDVDGDGWADLARFRRVTIRPRLFWHDGTDQAMLTAGYTAESRTGGGFVPGGIRVEQAIETARADAGASARLLLNERLSIDARGSATSTATDRVLDQRTERDIRTTGYGEISGRGSGSNHSWVVGLAMDYESLDAADAAPMLRYSQFTPGIFAQQDVAVAPWLAFSLSGRVDAHPEYGAFFNPRAAVMLGPFAAWTLRVSAGSGHRVPTPVIEEAGEIGFGMIEMAGDLRAERGSSVAFDIGAVLGELEVNVAVHGTTITDPLSFIEPDQPGPGLLVNLPGRGRTIGTELLARTRSEPLALTAFYSFVHAVEPDPFGAGRRRVPLTPTHAAGVILMLEDDDWGRFGVESYYTGRQRLVDDPFRDFAPRHLVLGALLERRIGPLSMFVNLENLTNVRQTRDVPLVRPAPTTTGRWTTDVYMPIEGRVINGGFRVYF